MKKVIKENQVWKNSKNKDLWAVMRRDLDSVSLVPVKKNDRDRRIRVLNLNNFLKKYYFDTGYYLLYGEYTNTRL